MITARPTTVEINPSIANVAHSIVWVTLTDIEGGPVPEGIEVLWTTDRCSIESSAVDTEAEYEAANSGAAGIFNNFNPLNPATAVAVESSVFATTAPDAASRQQEEDRDLLGLHRPGQHRDRCLGCRSFTATRSTLLA